MNTTHDSMLRRALVSARQWAGRCWPNPTVGAVLVGDEGWICEGVHRGAGSPHAEVEAIASAHSQRRNLSRSTLYVTLEPCNHHGRTAPCSEAILDAKIPRVVYACDDPNPLVEGGGATRLRAAGVLVERTSAHWQALATELNHPFLEGGFGARPHVTLKLAVDPEGRMARAPGRIEDARQRAITGERVQRRVHRMRAGSSCVVVGRGTCHADHPRLDVRRVQSEHRPRPVVLDSGLRSRPEELPDGCLLLHEAADPARVALFEAGGRECVALEGGPQAWPSVLSELWKRRLGIVLVEGGAAVADSLLASGLADRLHLFIAPARLGGDGPRADALAGLPIGADGPPAAGPIELAGMEWFILRRRRVGVDWEWVLRR